jgi:hypothetical protein
VRTLQREAPLLAPPRAGARRMMRFAVQGRLLQAYGPAVEEPVAALMGGYVTTCERYGVDPLVPVCQLLIETEFLTSPFRRLRVDEDRLRPPTKQEIRPWLASWAGVVRAHTALLLAYALPVGEENAPQLELLRDKVNLPQLPHELRGSAPKLDLFVRAWTPEEDYLDRLCEVGNSILMPQY